MPMPSNITAVRLAGMLLLHKGELSVDDIAALPLVEDEEEAALIISMLLRCFDAEIQQRRVESSAIPAWEEVILLKSKPKPVAIS